MYKLQSENPLATLAYSNIHFIILRANSHVSMFGQLLTPIHQSHGEPGDDEGVGSAALGDEMKQALGLRKLCANR